MKYHIDKIHVNAKTPEKAAKKVYRMNKRKYYELGYVKIRDETGQSWIFRCSDWLRRGSRMFKK